MSEGSITAEVSNKEPGPSNQETSRPIPVQAPHYYGSSFQLLGSPNDITIVLGRTLPYFNAGSATDPFTVGTEPQAIIHLSPQTAKELMILLQQQVTDFETAFGKLETPFIRAQTAQ